MLKAYKYRLYPTSEQKVLINKHIGACRWLYNYGLQKKIEAYARDRTHVSRFDLQADLPILKKTEEYNWLTEVNALSLQAVLRNLDTAYKNFFRDKKGFPKFKSKKNNRQSFQVVQNTRVNFVEDKSKKELNLKINSKTINVDEVYEDTDNQDNTVVFNKKRGTVSVPKIPNIPAVLHRTFKGEVKTCTISRTPTGKYYISVLVDNKEETLPEKQPLSENQAVAFDLGIKSFLVASNRDIIDNPKFLRKSEKKLARIQRQHSRKVKGSNNRSKHRIKLARIHEKVTNQRTDFLHQLTRKYINSEYTSFCFEDLNIKGMVRNPKLAKSINEVGWSTFRTMMTYKADWMGKNIITIGRFEPSSKLCSSCGTLKKFLNLNERTYNCDNPNCNLTIDRDYNASLNILKISFHHQNIMNEKMTKIGKELAESVARRKASYN